MIFLGYNPIPDSDLPRFLFKIHFTEFLIKTSLFLKACLRLEYPEDVALVTISFSSVFTGVGIDCSTASLFLVFQAVLPCSADSELVGLLTAGPELVGLLTAGPELVGLLTGGFLVFWPGKVFIDLGVMVFALFRCRAFFEDSGLMELILPLLLDRLSFSPLSFLLGITGLVDFILAGTWY